MKDAKGHGSDAGVHSAMIQALPAKLGRRHFEQIAEQLRAQAASDPKGHDARVAAMADHLSTTNPGFRRDLFVKASQPDTSYKNKSTRSVTRDNAGKQLRKFSKAANTSYSPDSSGAHNSPLVSNASRARPETRERTGADLLAKYRGK